MWTLIWDHIVLETRDSNPYYLDPKSSALPIKLVSRGRLTIFVGDVLCSKWLLHYTEISKNPHKELS